MRAGRFVIVACGECGGCGVVPHPRLGVDCPCPKCGGSGNQDALDHSCPKCDGTGTVPDYEDVCGDGGTRMQVWENCPDCLDKGECPQCGGELAPDEFCACSKCGFELSEEDGSLVELGDVALRTAVLS